jgi:hypothetical protein
MADRAAAEKGWVVRVTVMEEPGKPVYHYFLTGCGTEAEAIAVVRSYPGILAEDNVKTMRGPCPTPNCPSLRSLSQKVR